MSSWRSWRIRARSCSSSGMRGQSGQTQQINSWQFVEPSSITRRQCETAQLQQQQKQQQQQQQQLRQLLQKARQQVMGRERDWVLMTEPWMQCIGSIVCAQIIEMPFGKFAASGCLSLGNWATGQLVCSMDSELGNRDTQPLERIRGFN